MRSARISCSSSSVAAANAFTRASERGGHELPEHGLGPVRARLELGVVLRGHEERVIGQLDDLDQAVVRRRPAEHEAVVLEAPAQQVVDLVAVAVALVDHGLVVGRAGTGRVVELHRVGAEAHRPAHLVDLLLLRQQVDHRERRLGVELGGVGAVHADDVAREVDHGELHPEADTEERDLALARDPRRVDLALDAANAEAAGDQDAVGLLQQLATLLVVERLGVDPEDLDLGAVVDARVLERLDHGQVGVLELHVLADERDAHVLLRLGRAAHGRLPVAELGRRRLGLEVVEDQVVHALRPEHQRHLVDVVDVARGDHGLDRQAREQRDLLPDLA